MIDRALIGVDVRGVYEAVGSNGVGAELKTFWYAHTPVRQDGSDTDVGLNAFTCEHRHKACSIMSP
jgi:hypothetical protein